MESVLNCFTCCEFGMRSHESGSTGWKAAVNHLDDNWSISHTSKSPPKHALCKNARRELVDFFLWHASIISKSEKRPRWDEVTRFLLPPRLPFFTVLDETQARSWCQAPPNPAVEDCFLPCPGTKGSTRCPGTNPASSCWKQTPAPSASSACHFMLGLIPVDSACVRRAFHANETVQKWLKLIVVGLNSLY